MNNYLKNRFKKFILFSVLGIIALSFSIFMLSKNKEFDNKINCCRVITSKLINNIEECYSKDNIEDIYIDTYKYSLISLEGKVLKTTEDGIKSGQIESLRTGLGFDNFYEENNPKEVRYSTPIIINNKAIAMVRVIIPKTDILINTKDSKTNYFIILLIVSVFTILYSFYSIYKFIAIDILKPISQMHESAKAILKGDLGEKVEYDYQGEIGNFSHDFEAMRDNLKEAKESEQRLKKSEKELIACISHDLKTPIAAISGYCEGIIDGVVKEEKDIKKYSNIILKKSRVLTKLIDDMLEFSKAEINQMTIKKEEIYWSSFFTEVLEELSLDIESTGRKLRVEGEIKNIIVSIDRKRIQQVIYNLVSNSIKYTKNNGIITIKNEKKSEYIVISVKDDGSGIGEGDLPYVFNKFYRGEKHRNLDIPGSGLGLSIAKYIVEQHGGSIGVNSLTEQGTEVTFSILIQY